MKKLSCGIILVNQNKEILMIHTTSQFHWDLPKGTKNENETEIEAAIRELKEETGIEITKNKLTDLKWFPYNSHKDLWLFIGEMPNIEMDSLNCTSYFTKDGVELPEADDFKMIPLNEAPIMACNSMRRLLHDSLIKEVEMYHEELEISYKEGS